jgi:hypothetical protein
MMGYGPEDKNAVLELTYNYGVTEYEKGNAYAQVQTILNNSPTPHPPTKKRKRKESFFPSPHFFF